MNVFAMLMRRELWENRALILVPAIAAVLLPLAYLIGLVQATRHTLGLDGLVEFLRNVPAEKIQLALGLVPVGVASVFYMLMIIVLLFYLLDALYAERKDRSILFWKSLPVSDTRTVLSKLAIALLVVPAITFVFLLLTLALLSLLHTVFIWMGGGSAWGLYWQHVPLLGNIAGFLYAFAVDALWLAPLAAWLLLVSAWAKRAPLLWALIPPVALIVLEDLMFRSDRFAHLLAERLHGVIPLSLEAGRRSGGFDLLLDGAQIGQGGLIELIDPTRVLASSGLWLGLLVAAALTAGAIWLRRFRDET